MPQDRGDAGSLFSIRGVLHDAWRRPIWSRRDLDHPRWPEGGGGDGHDLGRRAVVRGELDHGRTRIAFGERRDGARIGAVPAVDRLSWVAHGEQVVAMAEPRVEQAQLSRVGVLELVDEEVLEPPALDGREAGIGGHVVGEAREKILEVKEPEAAFLLLVVRVPLGDLCEVGQWRSAGQRGLLDVTARRDQPRLGPLDLPGHRGDQLPPATRTGAGRPAHQREHEPREQAGLGIEDGWGVEVFVGGALAELGQRDRVEGASRHRGREAEVPQTGPQLSSGFAGERQGEDVGGGSIAMKHTPGNAPREDTGLA